MDNSSRSGILAGGNWISDHVKMIDTWPPQDALASILSETSSNGGSPYNLLKDLARLGAKFPLAAVGLVGDDADGDSILADCRAHQIDITQLQSTHEASTSYTDVMTEQSTGRRTFFHQRGANALLNVRHFDFTTTRARWFHLGYLLLLDRLDAFDENGRPRAAQILSAARAAGLKTSVDLVSENSDRFRSVVIPTLPSVDVLFANDFEAERLTGVSLDLAARRERHAVEKAGKVLLNAGVKEWVILHFPEAVYACGSSGESHWQPSLNLSATAIKGAAGAGDAFAAGVIFGLHEEWSIRECLQLGVCTAAASLSHPTCSEGVVSKEECLHLAAKYGYRATL